MLSKPYFIDFNINLTNFDINQNNLFYIINGKVTPAVSKFSIKSDIQVFYFSICHNNDLVYSSDQSFTENFSEIESIVVDNFWVFKTPFLKNTIQYSDLYLQHAKNLSATWEIEHKKDCKSLHFNGALEFIFHLPICRTFG